MDKKLKDEILSANKSVWDKANVNKIIKDGLYEAYFIMVDDIIREEAYWIRYTLMCPQTDKKFQKGGDLNAFIDDLGGDGMLWFGFFSNKEPKKNSMIKSSFPLSNVEGTKGEAIIKIEDSELRIDGLKGGFETKSGKKISWDLHFSHFMKPYITTPDLAKKLGFTNTLAKASHPNLRITGIITIDGNSKDLAEVPGIQYHTLGDGYKVPWEWLSAHTFKDNPDAYLDFGSKVAVGKSTVEFYDGIKSVTFWNEKVLKKLKLMKKINVEKSLIGLNFDIEFKGVVLKGEISVPKEKLIGVEYKGPQGNCYYCYNSEIADCKLIVEMYDEVDILKEKKEYIAENSVSFETIYEKPQEGIPYLSWEKEHL